MNRGDIVRPTLTSHPAEVLRVEPAPDVRTMPGDALPLRRVTARETVFGRWFVQYVVDANDRRIGAVQRGPYAHSFGCRETDGMEAAS